MDAVQEIRDAYTASTPHLERLSEYLREQLASYCESNGYMLKHRVKELPSIAAKLQQGRFESWADLDDLVAFTIVVPTRSHESPVQAWLSEHFEHHTTRSRETAEKAPDTFRFDAVRWYGRVAESSVVLPEQEPFRRFLFEVQVKTVFEDAWSVITHDVVYKGDDPSWGRARLASQLKAAVEQIDELVDHFESAASQLPSSPHRQTELIRSAIDTLRKMFDESLVDPELRPNSWASLMNNLWSFARKQRVADSDGYRRPERVFPALIAEFERAVRAREFAPLLSATLFDAIVACAIVNGKANAEEFFLVRSEILETAFGLDVPKAIDLSPAHDLD